MTNPNKTHITLICDRSGSMNAIRDDAEGGVRTFINEQKKIPGDCTLLLVDFDAPGADVGMLTGWYNVFHDGDIRACPDYVLAPRGMTALFDAIGKGIVQTGERLASLPEAERPGHVFFVVQTDGRENSSREYYLDQLIKMIKTQENDYAWTFIFLGVGTDAWAQSQAFVGTRMVNNVTRSADTGDAVYATYAAASASVGASRMGATDVNYGRTVDESGNVEEDEQA